MLVVAYFTSYLVGSAISFVILRRRLGGLEGAQLLRFGIRMLVVLLAAGAVTAAAAVGARRLRLDGSTPRRLAGPGRRVADCSGASWCSSGARLLRIREVTSLVDTVAARLRRG